MRVSLFITCTTHHSLTQVWCISEEGNIGTRQKKKTTAVGSASYCFWGLTSCGDSIFEEVAGFSPFMVSSIKKLFVSLVSCDVLMFYCCACYSLSEKILT